MNDNHRSIMGDKLKQSPFIADKDYVFVPPRQPVKRVVLLFLMWAFIVFLSLKTFSAGDYNLGALGVCVSVMVATVAFHEGYKLK